MTSSNAITARRSRRAVAADTGTAAVPIAAGEPILRLPGREISILVAREDITITHARYAGGQGVAGPHVHNDHTDAFYVLEGELAFTIGREAETIRVGAGGLVAAPPGVAHSFANASDRSACWLTIHARDGGFAAFMRGLRDGHQVEWDIAPVPADGGLPMRDATVSLGEPLQSARQPSKARCTLPDLHVVERHLAASAEYPAVPHAGTTVLVLAGELEATLAGTKQTADTGMLLSAAPGLTLALDSRPARPARVLTLQAPGSRLAPEPYELVSGSGA
jgi:quercetin dioxygenase-like cupin family protein